MKKSLLIFMTLLLLPLSTTPAYAANSINSITLEKNTVGVGDVVSWAVDVSCSTGPINQVYISLVDPIGVRQVLFNQSGNLKDPSKNGSKGIIKIPLKITAEASPGNYRVESVSLNCVNATQGTDYTDNLAAISFKVSDVGLTPAITQPQLEKLEMTTPIDRKIGDRISFHLVASSTGKINTIWIFLRNQDGAELFKMYSNYDANKSGPDTKRVDTTFDFDVTSDWPTGSWSIYRVEISGYAGTDLMTPWGFDPNPAGSTAVFPRAATIFNDPKVQSYGQPTNGQVPQANISSFKINVTNDSGLTVTAPEIVSISMPVTDIKAGDTFDMKVNIDGKGGYIYQLFGNWADKSTYNQTGASCYPLDLPTSPLQNIVMGATLRCKSYRNTAPGVYVMRQISVYTTSCAISLNDIGRSENQDCQQAPKQRRTDYSNAYGSASVGAFPASKTKLNNPLTSLATLNIAAPGPLARPSLQSAVVTDTDILFKYINDGEVTCSYSSSLGTLKTDGIKGDGSVLVLGLKPNTEVKLSANCKSSDGQSISFSDTAKTALPKPPALPTVINKVADLDSVRITFDDLTADGYDYEVSASDGSVLVLADEVEISDLDPNQSVDVSIKVTDPYGQSTSGLVVTVRSAAPPTLVAPRVSLEKSEKGNYLFSFKKIAGLKYEIKAVNCTARFQGNNIQVLNLVKKKPASVTLTVSDTFKQSASVKFFQYTSK